MIAGAGDDGGQELAKTMTLSDAIEMEERRRAAEPLQELLTQGARSDGVRVTRSAWASCAQGGPLIVSPVTSPVRQHRVARRQQAFGMLLPK
jgi:hypothetical protein